MVEDDRTEFFTVRLKYASVLPSPSLQSPRQHTDLNSPSLLTHCPFPPEKAIFILVHFILFHLWRHA